MFGLIFKGFYNRKLMLTSLLKLKRFSFCLLFFFFFLIVKESCGATIEKKWIVKIKAEPKFKVFCLFSSFHFPFFLYFLQILATSQNFPGVQASRRFFFLAFTFYFLPSTYYFCLICLVAKIFSIYCALCYVLRIIFNMCSWYKICFLLCTLFCVFSV